MSSTWPPPPDLPSLQELVRAADPLQYLSDGSPADEYQPEEDELFAAIKAWPTAQLLISNLLPILEQIWTDSSALTPDQLTEARPRLLSLAKEIERFFGPESKPRTRAEIISDNAAGIPAG